MLEISSVVICLCFRLQHRCFRSHLNFSLSVAQHMINCHHSSGQNQTMKKMFLMQGSQIYGPLSPLFINGIYNVQLTLNLMISFTAFVYSMTLFVITPWTKYILITSVSIYIYIYIRFNNYWSIGQNCPIFTSL